MHSFKINGGLLSAALSYQTIFILSPLLFFLVNLLNLFLDSTQTQEFILQQITQIYGTAISEFVESILENTRSWGNSPLINLVFVGLFLFGLTGFINQIRYSFNKVWEVHLEGKDFRGIALDQLFSLGLVLVLVLLIFCLFVVNLVLSNIFAFFPDNLVSASILNELGFFIIFSGLVFGLTKTLIHDKVNNWQLIIGIIHTGIFFTLGKIVLTWYFGQNNLLSLYGASSSLIVLLIWVNFSAQTIFFGLSLAKVLNLNKRTNPQVEK